MYPDLTGQILNGYQLVEQIGKGAVSTVYRAVQISYQRTVAIKVLPAMYAEDPNAAGILEHPHIVPVYEFGTSGDMAYVAMRLLEGGTLAQHLPNAPLPLYDILDLLRKLASALDFAHRLGTVHGNLKPGNVMFERSGNPMLTDFGTSKGIRPPHNFAKSELLIGSPDHMAPEQWQGTAPTAASDQYAIGVMAYTMLTGHLPFEAPDTQTLMNLHLHEYPPPPKTYRTDLPDAVTDVFKQVLAKEPSDRFANMTSYVGVFENTIAELVSQPAPSPALTIEEPGEIPAGLMVSGDQPNDQPALRPMLDFSIGVLLSHKCSAVETAIAEYHYIEPDHLFCGITKLQDFTTLDALLSIGLPPEAVRICKAEIEQILELFEAFNLDIRRLRRNIRNLMGSGGHPHSDSGHIGRSPQTKAYFEQAEALAQSVDAPVVAVQHLLAAVLEDRTGYAHQLLTQMGVDIDTLYEQAMALPVPTADDSFFPFLEQYGRDLTERAAAGELDAVVGRKDEMLQVIRTLARDKKNNPVLIGDAGVGKTAIVHGIATRIVTQNIHPEFHDKRIIQLSASDLMAGTSRRGDLEERVRLLIAEASNSDNIILFIDEIHMLVGATQDPMSMANLFKPALADGRLKVIGATTDAEYRQYIERDAALARRFQPIYVDEPPPDEAIDMLEALRPHLEAHHQVTIETEAIAAAVQLSIRYMPTRFLPDKAYDLLDVACSLIRFGGGISHRLDNTAKTANVVTVAAVRKAVSELTNIPVSELSHAETDRILHMGDSLRQRVIGQDHAIEAVVQIVQRHYAGLRTGKRPIGVFLFIGPTGVGKTEFAKATAEFLFGSESHMIRLDMSEFMEKHLVARLVGAPPGYVGYEQGGQLTEALRKTPHTVVLIDEIEKAHPDVMNIFLQVFDDGRLTDGHGRTIDATNALFIITSNFTLARQIGFAPQEEDAALHERLLDDLKHTFSMEFLNRLDSVISFRPLQMEHIEQIVYLRLDELRETIRQQKLDLQVTDKAIRWLCEKGYDQESGARPLQRIIQQTIESQLGEQLLGTRLQQSAVVNVDVEGDQIIVKLIPS